MCDERVNMTVQKYRAPRYVIYILICLGILFSGGCSHDDLIVNYGNQLQEWEIDISLGSFTLPKVMYDSLPAGQRYVFSNPDLTSRSPYETDWGWSSGSIYGPSDFRYLLWDAPDSGGATISLSVTDTIFNERIARGSIDLRFHELGPRLTIPESKFDFGFVPQHSVVSHAFPLYSTGGKTLKITKIVPG